MNSRTWPLATFCFALTFGIYCLFVDTQGQGASTLSGTTLADWALATGFFSIVFSAAAFLYERFVFSFINRSVHLSGAWHQVFIIAGDEPISERVRYGECQITSSLDTIRFSAINLKLDGSFSSNWNSETVVVQNKQVSLMFRSEGNRNSSRGTMNFNIQGSPPQALIGNFNDSSPAKHHGDIRIFKSKSDQLKWIEEISKGT